MSFAAVNTDLSAAYLLPGVYVQLNLTGSGAALGNPQLRALLVAYKSAAGTAAQDTPILATGQNDANLKAGRGSELAALHAAFLSQIGGGQCDVYLLPIVAPTGGTAATRTLTISLLTGSNPAAQDSIQLWIAGVLVSITVATTDTPTTIATNLAAAVNNNPDLRWTAAASTGTLTLTYRHASLTGEDTPIMAFAPNNANSNVQIAFATITYSGTSATGAGSATVSIGGSTVSAVINSSDTPSIIATSVAAAINATNFPVTASAAAGVVTLFARNDPTAQTRVVQRPSAAIVTSTGITVTVAAGTAGSGAPNLTNALAVLAAQSAFGYWATSFNDTVSLGALSAHVETQANGVYQKDQFLWACSTGSLTTAMAIPTGTTPALTASGRYHLDWCQDSPQQAFELAARHAAMVCVQSSLYPGYNYDGAPFLSQTATVPLLLPDRAVRPSGDSQNTAITNYLTPLAVNEQTGQLVVVRGRNTLNSPDARQWDTSLLQCAAFTRYNTRTMLRTKFANKSIKSVGAPRTPNTITVQNVADAIIELLYQLDNADVIDGAAQLKAAVLANINVVNSGRVDLYVPVRFPVPMHQVAPVVALQ